MISNKLQKRLSDISHNRNQDSSDEYYTLYHAFASDFYGIEFPLGGGTMHGKDLSKADCSVNIYCYLLAQETGEEIKAICSIGDKQVNINGQLVDFTEIVAKARQYINKLGGFEKLAEWGLQ